MLGRGTPMHTGNGRLSRLVGASVLMLAVPACRDPSSTRRSPEAGGQTPVGSIVGTWTGTSTCVGDRPACKNEIAVYRLVAVEGHPHQVRWLGDKVIDG